MNPEEARAPVPSGDTESARRSAEALASARPGRAWQLAAAVALALLLALSLALAWNSQERMKSLEQELVRRQQDSQAQAAEARVLAKQAQDSARDAVAKVALLEGRVAENTMQRSQLEELLQSMSRSRDENLLADIDSSLRVAVQQSALTGSTDPLLASLRQAEERLARYSQPRLDRVRRALAQDIERARTAGAVDVATLAIRLDEAVRLADEMPLLVQPERRAGAAPRGAAPSEPQAASAPAAAASASGWSERIEQSWQALLAGIRSEARALVRVSTIENPEAILITPEQAYFLRANLKLRLLNARLALLSRQFDTAQSDLRDAQAAVERYFDRGSRRVSMTNELIKQVAAQTRQLSLPRPDATLAAIAAAQAGR